MALPIRADTVASLLGNFTINQFCGVSLSDDSVGVHYTVVFGQLPALHELHVADTNGDGVTSQAERDAYAQRLAPQFAKDLDLRVDGSRVPLHLTHSTSSLPVEQGGFSLRLDADFAASLPPAVLTGEHQVKIVNHNFDGRIGWREIAVHAGPTIQIFNTNAFNTSLTSGLTQALQALPASGPLDERAVHLFFTHGAAPGGSSLLGPRLAGTRGTVAAVPQASNGGETEWLQRETRRLIALISAPHVAPRITLLALLAAFALGALHAFSPGHGKTIVGAYLIGSRGTPKHAVFLGLMVTITHTLGVFTLGFATLFASRFFVPERLFPVLSLLSGLIVFGMGMILLAQRWRGAKAALARWPRDAHIQSRQALSRRAAPSSGSIADPAHDDRENHPDHYHIHDDTGHHGSQLHSHAQHHHHDHGHQGADDGSILHSHGGSMHSHIPPGADGAPVTWRSLVALGISGGLVPCPSAMVLLLAAVALNKTAYGMLLVLAFSVGLAVTLTVVGLAFLYARSRFRRPNSSARWPHLLPVMSAGVITAVGLALCLAALQSTRF